MKYLSVVTLLVFMLVPASVFSQEDVDITQAKSFTQHTESYAVFLERLAFSVLVEGGNFAKGKNVKFKYDFKNSDYKKLLEEYKIKDIAGKGSSFEKLARVMDNFAYRLTHDGNRSVLEKLQTFFQRKDVLNLSGYDYLKYSLDNKDHGIPCNLKSIILYETGRALGMYTRRVWIAPLDNNMDSPPECHAMIEVWDESLNKWVMLDMTSNLYWVDSKGTPLSTLELRDKLVNNEKGLKVVWGSHPIKGLDLKSKYKDPKEYELEYASEQYYFKLYYLKNIYVLQYLVGNPATQSYYLVPNNFSYKNKVSKNLTTRVSVEASPIGK